MLRALPLHDALLGVALLTQPTATQVSAHHYDHSEGHSGYLSSPAVSYEMNARTGTAQSIPIQTIVGDANWSNAL